MVGLLEENRGADERRWQPRVALVLPAQVHFDPPSGEELGGSFLVATTDISIEGAGILAWRELPVRQMTLEVAGVRFACEVRWCKRLGGPLYRYGLHFLHLLDERPRSRLILDSHPALASASCSSPHPRA